MTDRFKEALDVRYSVIKNPRSTPLREWCVIDKKGEAELGNWVIAECTFYDFADLICRALTLATEAEQLRKERDELAREISYLKDEIAILNGENDE